MDMNTPLSSVMTRNVIAISPKEAMSRVQEIFEAKLIHHIPVVDEKKQVVGIISLNDYHKILHGLTLFRAQQSKTYNTAILSSLLVEDVMTKKVAKLSTTDTVETAAGFFKENLFHALPIVDKNDKLVGIVTTYDLLTFAFSPRQFLQ